MIPGEKIWVGNITHVIRHSGRDTGSFDELNVYDSFGNLVYEQGIGCPGNLGLQSKYYDQETGLYYFYHRYYSPTIGRFINEDPIKFRGGKNFYGYALNNPQYLKDFFGLKPGLQSGCKLVDYKLDIELSRSEVVDRIGFAYPKLWKDRTQGPAGGVNMSYAGPITAVVSTILGNSTILFCDFDLYDLVKVQKYKRGFYHLKYECNCGALLQSYEIKTLPFGDAEYEFRKSKRFSFSVAVGTVINSLTGIHSYDCYDHFWVQYGGD